MRQLEILNDRLARWQYQAVHGGSLKKRQKGLRKIKEIQKTMGLLNSPKA
jgi:hypothetical protein